MKKLTAFKVVVLVLLAGGLVFLVTHTLANHYLSKPARITTATCSHIGATHTVIVEQGVAIPQHTDAKLCDKLTIVNSDNQIRLMAFGEHENHQAYDGVVERALDKGQSLSVTLNKPGTYKFHDHLDDQSQGIFTVK